MNLATLKYAEGSRKKRKRIGRGPGSGHGGTATRGHKGQKSRSGATARPWFEGGQMPIQRRLPRKGFTNIFKKEFQILNLKDLQRLENVDKIDPEILYQRGLIKKKRIPVKILGEGEINRAIEIAAHAFSKTAVEKIQASGGKVTIL